MNTMNPEDYEKYKESQRKASSIVGIILLVAGFALAANLSSMSGLIQFIIGIVALVLIISGIIFILQ